MISRSLGAFAEPLTDLNRRPSLAFLRRYRRGQRNGGTMHCSVHAALSGSAGWIGGRGRWMRELRLHSDGLRLEETDRPVPGEGEVLVRVHAAAITRNELEWPTDRLPAVPSYELSGVVAATGEEVFALTPFDRDGVAADYALVPAVVLAAKPVRLTHVEAAALPIGGLSAWQGLFVHGRLQAGERVLVTGGSGGVGHLAVQLAPCRRRPRRGRARRPRLRYGRR